MATILIVDDDEMERLLLRDALGERHRLLFAPDGEVALRIHDDEPRIHLVITDIHMPRVNGLRLIRELQERKTHAVIIAVSGVSADQLDLAEDYGAYRILYKPLEKNELMEAVRDALTKWKGKQGW